MFELVMTIIIAAITVVFLLFGMLYIRTTKESVKANCSSFNKQDFVQKNRFEFGVENRGTSMDGKEIFTVSPVDMGL